jgi:hypothetical protein
MFAEPARVLATNYSGLAPQRRRPSAPRVVDPCLFQGTMSVIETFNNWWIAMATVNFSVPDDVKSEFDKFFGDQNKSAVIAELMRSAVAEVKRRKQRESIFRALTQRRTDRPSLTDKQIRASRTAGRS